MKLTLGQLRKLIGEALITELQRPQQPNRFFHGSTHEFKVGQVLSGGKGEKTSEFPAQLEQVFEEFRPKSMASRLTGVFMVSRPGNVNWAGGSTDFVYEVEPLGPVHSHSQYWFNEAYGAVSSVASRGWPVRVDKNGMKEIAPQLEECAVAYWSGAAPPKGYNNDAWEWLTRRARIIKKVRAY